LFLTSTTRLYCLHRTPPSLSLFPYTTLFRSWLFAFSILCIEQLDRFIPLLEDNLLLGYLWILAFHSRSRLFRVLLGGFKGLRSGCHHVFGQFRVFGEECV